MKTVETGGLTAISPVPGGTSEWYYCVGYEHGDLYEAEEVFNSGGNVEGRGFCLIHFPDGTVYRPVKKERGTYLGEPVFYDGNVYFLRVDFNLKTIEIMSFSQKAPEALSVDTIPLSSVKNCYNLRIDTAPLTVSRQSVSENELEIIWPERLRLEMGDHDSFFMRDGKRLFFSRWHEEGDGEKYRYWEEIVVKDMNGNVIETLPGDIVTMPDGQKWHIK